MTSLSTQLAVFNDPAALINLYTQLLQNTETALQNSNEAIAGNLVGDDNDYSFLGWSSQRWMVSETVGSNCGYI